MVVPLKQMSVDVAFPFWKGLPGILHICDSAFSDPLSHKRAFCLKSFYFSVQAHMGSTLFPSNLSKVALKTVPVLISSSQCCDACYAYLCCSILPVVTNQINQAILSHTATYIMWPLILQIWSHLSVQHILVMAISYSIHCEDCLVLVWGSFFPVFRN